MVRVNFGNGQVYDVATVAEGFRFIRETDASMAWVERYMPGTADDPGCWVRVRREA